MRKIRILMATLVLAMASAACSSPAGLDCEDGACYEPTQGNYEPTQGN